MYSNWNAHYALRESKKSLINQRLKEDAAALLSQLNIQFQKIWTESKGRNVLALDVNKF